ncbi:hypothetical protein NQZ68_001795 [Dissostichus eleginoides]|nr:hypothetical protein NQZ68_001795 [Dissostichus eleginoides]
MSAAAQASAAGNKLRKRKADINAAFPTGPPNRHHPHYLRTDPETGDGWGGGRV